MQPLRKFLEANFRIKVLIPVVAVMALILATTVFIVNQQFWSYAKDNGLINLKSAGLAMNKNLVRYQQSLNTRFKTLGHVSMYRAAFEKGDVKTIRNQLELMYKDEDLRREGIEFAFYTPVKSAPSGTSADMIYIYSSGSLSRMDILDQSAKAVKEAFKGTIANDTILINKQLCELVSIPIYSRTDECIGALTLGQMINEQVFQLLSLGNGGQMALIGGDSVMVSSFNDSEMTDELRINLVQGYQQLSRKPTADAPRIVISRNPYFYSCGQLPSLTGDRSLGYLLFSPHERDINFMQNTQHLLLATIIIMIILGAALVLFFINRATAPLRELHAAAVSVGHGDFSQRVHIKSKDEFGELGYAFNQMTENIELSQSKLKQTVDTLKSTQSQLIQSEKLSAVGEFVAGVAHELNNPLAAVLGFSEMLKNADVGEKHARHLDLIYKSAERCKKIVQSLLSFARRQQPERKPAQINKLIEDVLDMVAYPLRTSNVKVVTQFSTGLPIVLADGHQVQQVVLNLINNARQAIETASGSGRITITTQHGAQIVRIIIQDNGPGISPENLKRIFDPFFTTKEVGQGTGLGLSLCYGIIHEHGGNILATSAPGEGATFTIELPVADEAAWFETAFTTKTATSPAPTDVREGAGKRILCVDDEESLLHMIKEELTAHSYEVITAPNGEAALREVRAQKFDAIICDLKMPGLNGRQVYERLREENPLASRRMVFVTGDIIGDQLKNFLETEKRPCLTKPFSLADLRQAVRKQLAEK